MTPHNKDILHIEHLAFSYPDTPGVIRDFSLQVFQGEKVGIIGPNGAGKSTLFLLITGVLSASEGEIRFMGAPLQPGNFYPEMALVFQQSDDQLFCPTVWDDVAFGPRNMGLSDSEIEKRVDTSLAQTGTAQFSHKVVHHLSEGQKRMVAIAGALAMRPELILYDEPSASLDIRSRRQLISLLQSSRHAMLLASHDLELVLEVCSRVVLLDDGEIVAEGDPRKIMADEELMRAHGQEKPHSLVPHQLLHSHT
ncbi:energy-coupling factor ABC transporter ATP-binding protein [Desulfurispira natronophila]|uniref:Cobalt/nickel transport system ATP-binding protein n=1 Tax=Desulfurispira natronophila TaxID=682562 RepID=A0A7W7Y5L7_9BACT|nr:ABC transporter ATP-binding protein [Desulfurispira natronophila]MBB5022521.1 cobalt/nickel transport system ATP-binding protein [Desulfurispira natronophila]